MTPLLTSTPCVGPHPMSTPPGEHPTTPTAPRVSAEPEESIHPSPQHLRSPSLGDADLRLIQARHSQGRPLQPPPTDPASPEVDEPWYSDPGASVDPGGWDDVRPRSHETPKRSAPLTTSTSQTAPRPERPPSPQPTPTTTRVTPSGTVPPTKGTPTTNSPPGGLQTPEMPSLQELWLKMSRFIEAQEAQHKLEHPPQPLPPPILTSTRRPENPVRLLALSSERDPRGRRPSTH